MKRLLPSLYSVIFVAFVFLTLPLLAQEEKTWRSEKQKQRGMEWVRYHVKIGWTVEDADLRGIENYTRIKEFRDAWNISEAQQEKIDAILSQILPAYDEFPNEYEELRKLTNGFSLENLDPVAEAYCSALYRYLRKKRAESQIAELSQLLTDEQKQKFREFFFAGIKEGLAGINANSLRVLDLSEEQRGALERIPEELGATFWELVDQCLATVWRQVNIAGSMISDDEWRARTYSDLREKYCKFYRQLNQENPTFRGLSEEFKEQNLRFTALCLTKVNEILTEDQKTRLRELTDNPSPENKELLRYYKAEMGLSDPPERRP